MSLNVEKLPDTVGIGDVAVRALDGQLGSANLLRALIRYALRHNQTLPGMSAAQTRALALNRGVAW